MWQSYVFCFADVTVLLSLTVFMNLVSAIMPTTSDAVPLIGTKKKKKRVQVSNTGTQTEKLKMYQQKQPTLLALSFPVCFASEIIKLSKLAKSTSSRSYLSCIIISFISLSTFLYPNSSFRAMGTEGKKNTRTLWWHLLPSSSSHLYRITTTQQCQQ